MFGFSLEKLEGITEFGRVSRLLEQKVQSITTFEEFFETLVYPDLILRVEAETLYSRSRSINLVHIELQEQENWVLIFQDF